MKTIYHHKQLEDYQSKIHHLHLKSDELRNVLRKVILDNFPEYDTAIKNIDKKR